MLLFFKLYFVSFYVFCLHPTDVLKLILWSAINIMIDVVRVILGLMSFTYNYYGAISVSSGFIAHNWTFIMSVSLILQHKLSWRLLLPYVIIWFQVYCRSS